MDDQVEALLFEELQHFWPIPDVHLAMNEALGGLAQPFQIPTGIAQRTEKFPAQIIIHAKDPVSFAIIILDRFRTDESAGAGDQNFHGMHFR